MFSFNLHNNLFQIKQNVFGSAATLVFLHKVQPFHGPKLIRSYRSKKLIRFCSTVDVELCGVSPRTGGKKPQIAENLGIGKSYIVSYLINSCGLSPETALPTSEKVYFKNSENPDFVLDLLEENGFSKTQIAVVVRRRPRILLAKEKTLLPKLKFFRSIGMSKDYIAAMISRDPTILTRSLGNQIIPNYKFLKSILLTDERVATSVKRTSWLFLENIQKHLAPNIEVLKEMKVPESCIRLLLTHFPNILLQNCDEFRESVWKISEMGFDPWKSSFVLGLRTVSGDGNQVTWTRCYETYSEWGWSKDDIYEAFRKQPNCMLKSQKKIHNTMDFFVNKMGWNSRMIAKTPSILLLNLENTIVPRSSVVKVLSLRGFISKDFKLSTTFSTPEKYFLEKFVVKYEKEVPQLHDLYKGKIGIEELLHPNAEIVKLMHIGCNE